MTAATEIRAAIGRWFRRRQDELIADVGRLIAQPSAAGEAAPGAPYGINARAALDLSRDILRKLGFMTAVFEDCMLEADLNVSGGETPEFGLLVHADTVAASREGWKSDPFCMDIRGGKLYGRGATDNKGPAAASMYALAAARDVSFELGLPLRRGARLIAGTAEELGCADMSRYLLKRKPPRYCVAPDAVFPVVNVEKGRFVMKFRASWERENTGARVTEIRGGATTNIVPHFASARVGGLSAEQIAPLCARYTDITAAVITAKQDGAETVIAAFGASSHASRPEDGNNAQTALLALLAALPLSDCGGTRAVKSLARLFPHGVTDGSTLGIAARDDASGALTLSFGVLELNETGFTADFDSRTPKITDSADITGTAAKKLKDAGFTVTEHTATRCHVTDKDSPFVRTLLSIYEAHTNMPGACLSLGGTTYAHNIPGAVAFGCETPGVNHRIHGADEFIPLDTLFKTGEMLAETALVLLT